MRWPWRRKPTDHYWGGAIEFTAADFAPGGSLFYEHPAHTWARRREGELRRAMQREHAMAGRFPVAQWWNLERDTIEVTAEALYDNVTVAEQVASMELSVREGLRGMGYDEKAIDAMIQPRVGQWRADAEVRAKADETLYGGGPYHVAPPSNAPELREYLRRISGVDVPYPGRVPAITLYCTTSPSHERAEAIAENARRALREMGLDEDAVMRAVPPRTADPEERTGR